MMALIKPNSKSIQRQYDSNVLFMNLMTFSDLFFFLLQTPKMASKQNCFPNQKNPENWQFCHK